MKTTTYIIEITSQKDEKYLSEGRKLGSTCLLCEKKKLSQVVSSVPSIFTGIFFYHSFYGMT